MPVLLKDFFGKVRPAQTTYTDEDYNIRPIRHANYYKLKDFVARCKIADINYLPSCQQIEDKEGIGRSSVNRHMITLCEEGWLRRVIIGKSKRSIYYRIVATKDVCVNYRFLFTPSGRKRKSKKILPCDNSVIIRGL